MLHCRHQKVSGCGFRRMSVKYPVGIRYSLYLSPRARETPWQNCHGGDKNEVRVRPPCTDPA